MASTSLAPPPSHSSVSYPPYLNAPFTTFITLPPVPSMSTLDIPDSDEEEVKIPRPPNAWIIYRSEKLKELRSRPPEQGAAPKIMSDVSKVVADLWKREPPSIRSHFEHLAEVAKANHSARYPNYRFMPMKKADKIKARELKKLKKENSKKGRQAAAQPYQAPSPHTLASPNAFYSASPSSLAAASPPMSLASSPSPPPPAALPVASTSASTIPSASSGPQSVEQSLQTPEAHELGDLSSDGEVWHTDSQAHAASLESLLLPDLGATGWPVQGDEAQSVSVPQSVQQEFVSFEIPQVNGHAFQEQEGEMFFAESLSALLGEVNVFPLQGLDTGLTEPPPGSIDISVNPSGEDSQGGPTFNAQFQDLLDSFNFHAYDPVLDSASFASQVGHDQWDLTLPTPQTNPDEFNGESMMNFLDLDAPASALQQPSMAPAPQPRFPSTSSIGNALGGDQPRATSTSTVASDVGGFSGSFHAPSPYDEDPVHQAYIPPAGAVNAGTRRVGGSWKVPVPSSGSGSPALGDSNSPQAW